MAESFRRRATTSAIGYSGSGTLNIGGGGSFVSGSATIANVSGSSGTVVVTGPGSNWTTTSNIFVGKVAQER